ncbi:MAG: hypothetical protein D6824_03815, partial [Planctomycetota bacterium]
KADVAITAPGSAGFARFAKLPPVEPKKVPDIVKFEAVQQIPFPIEEVEWDFQTFQKPDSPDVEVGIFAMTRERVMERLRLCEDVGIEPVALTLSPVAVYNAMAYDLALTPESPPVVFLDIGTRTTDLIVADAGRVWIRTFPMGGHNFTEAVAEAFKLPYTKAEKLKREAERSRHKRHIFQAMRSVFVDFAQEVQRSISYYNQLHPETELKRIIGLGATFRLLGLRRFLSQQLQMDVQRLEQFSRAQIEGADASDVQAEALCLATAYGASLQGLGLAPIDANLVPAQVVRQQVWKRKPAWFMTAAGLSLAAGAAAFYQPIAAERARQKALNSPGLARVEQVVSQASRLKREAEQAMQAAVFGAKARNVVNLFVRKDLMKQVAMDLGAMLASGGADKELILSGKLRDMPPAQWPVFHLQSFDVDYVTPSGGAPASMVDQPVQGAASPRRRGGRAAGGGGLGGGGFTSGAADPRARRSGRSSRGQRAQARSQYGKLIFRLVVDSPHRDEIAFVNDTILKWLRDNADRPDALYTYIPVDFSSVVKTPVERREGEGASSKDDPLASLAPIATPPPPFPPEAHVNRYVIVWEAALKAPVSAVEQRIKTQLAKAEGAR